MESSECATFSSETAAAEGESDVPKTPSAGRVEGIEGEAEEEEEEEEEGYMLSAAVFC